MHQFRKAGTAVAIALFLGGAPVAQADMAAAEQSLANELTDRMAGEGADVAIE